MQGEGLSRRANLKADKGEALVHEGEGWSIEGKGWSEGKAWSLDKGQACLLFGVSVPAAAAKDRRALFQRIELQKLTPGISSGSRHQPALMSAHQTTQKSVQVVRPSPGQMQQQKLAHIE